MFFPPTQYSACRDLEDVRYLLRHLDIASADEALAVVTMYFNEAQIPGKTRLALKELVPKS